MYLLLTTYYVLLSTYYLLLIIYYLLLTTYYLPLTTYHLLLTIYYLLLTTYCLLLTTTYYYVLLPTYYYYYFFFYYLLLLLTHYLLLTTYYLLLTAYCLPQLNLWDDVTFEKWFDPKIETSHLFRVAVSVTLACLMTLPWPLLYGAPPSDAYFLLWVPYGKVQQYAYAVAYLLYCLLLLSLVAIQMFGRAGVEQ